MKFHEKLLALRKQKGLSQEELGMELQVSRQTISKWEAGQSYPDFTKLVLLSDFFNLSLDELVKDIDVQEVQEKNFTDEKVAEMYLDYEKSKSGLKGIWRVAITFGFVILGIAMLALILHFIFPDLSFFWQRK
ncbi:helix-turn-helix domain-containing protein [Enterococcus alishanensis]